MIKIAVENAIICGKNMCTLLKYAKMGQHAKYAAFAYSRLTDMPNYTCFIETVM